MNRRATENLLSNFEIGLRQCASICCLLLAWTNIAVAGDKVLYQGETTIGTVPSTNGEEVATLSARAGTIVNYDDKGGPDFIGFANEKGIVQGEYGIDNEMKPKNSGRIFYTSAPGKGMPFVVVGANDIYEYHLKYLELTTVENDNHEFVAYVTKAIAFDNKVETLSKKPNLTFSMPKGGELVVDHGTIKIGDDCISPNYNASGKIVDPKTRVHDGTPTTQQTERSATSVGSATTQPSH